jgi:hypothetical protein
VASAVAPGAVLGTDLLQCHRRRPRRGVQQPGTEGRAIVIRITNPQDLKTRKLDQMIIDFSTSEMRAARREARWLLIDAAYAGFMLVKFAGDNLAGAKDAMSTSNWILVGTGCCAVVASAACGRRVVRILASIHRHLARSQVFIVSALACLCGSILGGALAWLRAGGFRLDTQFGNPAMASGAFYLFFIAAGWLISAALLPMLLNRRSLQ